LKISTRLTIILAVAAILPLFVAGVWGFYTLRRANALATERGQEILTTAGEEAILLIANRVALEIELYLASHPEVDLTDAAQLEANAELAQIAVQSFGSTGYTAVFDEQGITHFHPDPTIVGVDLESRADALPFFWQIISQSLDGSPADGYYDWEDADGQMRPKYMSILPIGDTPLRVAATTYIDDFSEPVVQIQAELDRLRETAQTQWLVSLVAVGIVAVVAASIIGRWFSRPIHEMANAAEMVAEGDLRVEPPSTPMGELRLLADAFAEMTANLRAIIHRVRTMSFNLSSSADQVMMTQRRHTTNSDEQAAAATSASAAAEELASSSAHIASTIQQVVAAAEQTQANTQQGVEVMAEAARHLKRIATSNEASVAKVRDLGELARQIGTVMDLIEDIAAQTKMIAFNASIEASAAGEAGRRFAIVAGEVRRLAGDVARSTEEIRQNVERIQANTNELIIASERESKEIEGGLDVGDTMSDLLDQIHESAVQTALAIQQISFSTRQQQSATEQLLEDLQPMAYGAQAIAAGSKETVTVMESLVTMAQDLNVAVERFQLPEEP
jgi:methyl-accepting chemotaxis protein